MGRHGGMHAYNASHAYNNYGPMQSYGGASSYGMPVDAHYYGGNNYMPVAAYGNYGGYDSYTKKSKGNKRSGSKGKKGGSKGKKNQGGYSSYVGTSYGPGLGWTPQAQDYQAPAAPYGHGGSFYGQQSSQPDYE